MSKKILIIDDNHEHRQLVIETLSEEGYEVTAASDGIEGLSAYRAQQFDLVITDVLMPGADGLEVIRAIREAGFDVPVIAMSGGGASFPAAISLSASRALGAAEVLHKPFRISELTDAVRRVLKGGTTRAG